MQVFAGLQDLAIDIRAWNWFDIGWRAIALVATWVTVWFLVKRFSVVLQLIDQNNDHISARDIMMVDKLLDYAFIVIGIVISLALLRLTNLLYSALTAAGIVGVMIGFATKDVAANFVSGIFIILDRPFVVGDAVKIGEHSGTVKDISLRSTTIATWDGPVVCIPNSTVATTSVTNYSVAQERRVSLTVSVTAASDIDLAESIIREIVEADERISKDRAPIIYISDLQDFALSIQVFVFVDINDLLAVQSDLRKQIVHRFRTAGIVLATPVMMQLTPDGSEYQVPEGSN